MNVRAMSRVDLHCHSTASQLSKLGVQRALGLPECATPPEEVYELAKRRGMDFVTITDHDTIAGVQQIADRPDVFVSEELSVIRTPPRAPRANAHVERFIGTCRRECLDRLLIFHQQHLEWVLQGFVEIGRASCRERV